MYHVWFYNMLHLATRINTMAIGNGSLSLCLTIATIKNNEKEDFGKHCWKRRKCWIPAFSPFPTMLSILAQTTQYSLHIVFGQQIYSTLTNLEFYSMEKSLCTTVVIIYTHTEICK